MHIKNYAESNLHSDRPAIEISLFDLNNGMRMCYGSLYLPIIRNVLSRDRKSNKETSMGMKIVGSRF